MSFSSVAHFIRLLDDEIETCAMPNIVVITESGPRALTNAAFLLGAYMLLKLDRKPSDILSCFSAMPKSSFRHYRDATYSESDFDLRLIDCWGGLQRGKELGWLNHPTQSDPNWWGGIDIEEYEHYDDPLNGDLHQVVPMKFVAFRGPRDMKTRGTKLYSDDEVRGTRDFKPHYYVDVFHELGVTDVVRLNENEYDKRAFTVAGINHHDLYFDDCTAPPSDIVDRFFRIAAAAKGLVAVHCKAGLGRTGTLIARCMMRNHGFTAREAMGWLRVMRPGSVIGEQQHYLCEMERVMAAPRCGPPARMLRRLSLLSWVASSCTRLDRIPSTPSSPKTTCIAALRPAASPAVLAAQVSEGMRTRGSALSARTLGGKSLRSVHTRPGGGAVVTFCGLVVEAEQGEFLSGPGAGGAGKRLPILRRGLSF